MGILVLFNQKIQFKIICVHIDRFIPIYTQRYIISTIYIEFRPFYTFQAEIVRMINSEYINIYLIILYGDQIAHISVFIDPGGVVRTHYTRNNYGGQDPTPYLSQAFQSPQTANSRFFVSQDKDSKLSAIIVGFRQLSTLRSSILCY